MKIKIVFITALLGSMLAGSVAAQTKPAVTKFTSVYTNLSRSCKTLPGRDGTDDASLCKGAGNYQVRLYYSAASSHINAEVKGTDDSISLATLSVGFDESKTTLEWRLANGKPFAVIMRRPIYSENVAEGEYFGKVMGQKLVVIGLIGFGDAITGEVDAKTPNANVKARELADKAYTAAKAK
jgi:hypothetical protein